MSVLVISMVLVVPSFRKGVGILNTSVEMTILFAVAGGFTRALTAVFMTIFCRGPFPHDLDFIPTVVLAESKERNNKQSVH